MIRLLSTAIICLALAACGGGGGGGGGGDDSGSSNKGSSSGGASAPGSSSPGLGARPPAPPIDENISEGSEPASVNLSWTPPSARENGDPLPMGEILGYEIFYYVEGTGEEEAIRVKGGSQTSYTVEVPGPGTYHFAMIAVDVNGLASDNSNYVSVTID